MTAQELADGSKCIACALPPGLEGPALIFLLSRLANVTNTQEIINGANCYSHCIPQGMQMAAVIFLLNTLTE